MVTPLYFMHSKGEFGFFIFSCFYYDRGLSEQWGVLGGLKLFSATYNVTLGMFHHECELLYIPTESPECLTQQSPADHSVSFLAMSNMGDHACTIFSIERHIGSDWTARWVASGANRRAAVWPAKYCGLALTVVWVIEVGIWCLCFQEASSHS